MTSGRGFGTNKTGMLNYTVDVQQFKWYDMNWIELYHHAIYRADATTFKYTLTPVKVGIDDGSLFYSHYYSVFIKHGVPVNYPSA